MRKIGSVLGVIAISIVITAWYGWQNGLIAILFLLGVVFTLMNEENAHKTV